MASAAVRSTPVPSRPKPSIAGTKLREPVARIRRSYGSVSPVPSATCRRSRSIRSARVFSHVVIARSSYHWSGFRYRPCMAERPYTSRLMPMRL